MPHALLDNGLVIQLDLTCNPPDGYVECPDGVMAGYIFRDGGYHAPDPEDPVISDYESAIQALVDATATERKFRDGVTMASYVNSTNPQWAAEAVAFVAWRDGVWAYAYSELDKVMTGQRPQPTIEEFLAEIDPIDWPSV